MARVSTMSAQMERDREKGQLKPIIQWPDSWITAFSGPSPRTYPVTQEKEGWYVSVMKKKKVCVFQEKRVKRKNKPLNDLMGITYQVPLFFPSFHVFLEALWKHRKSDELPKSAPQGWVENDSTSLAVSLLLLERCLASNAYELAER